MRQHQHKLLAVGINHAERQIIMSSRTEKGIGHNIAKVIIHKAHVPFQVKAEAVLIERPRYSGPRRGLLSDHEHTGIPLLHDGI